MKLTSSRKGQFKMVNRIYVSYSEHPEAVSLT